MSCSAPTAWRAPCVSWISRLEEKRGIYDANDHSMPDGAGRRRLGARSTAGTRRARTHGLRWIGLWRIRRRDYPGWSEERPVFRGRDDRKLAHPGRWQSHSPDHQLQGLPGWRRPHATRASGQPERPGAGRQHAADGIHQRPGGRRELLVERQGTHRHEVHADGHWPRLYARATGLPLPRSAIPHAENLRRRRDGPPLRGQSEREARIAGPPDYRRGTGGWPPYHHNHPRRTGGQRSAHRHRGGKLVFAGLADHGTFQAFGPAYWGNRDPADEHRPRRTRAHAV